MSKSETTTLPWPSGLDAGAQSLKHLEGFRILASDGLVGKVYDFFFNDQSWMVRYLVADTGHWLPGRKVLLPTPMLIGPNLTERSFAVSLTREQVKTSPDVDTDMPVSRLRELELQAHYDWPFHWGCVDGWVGPVPPAPAIEPPIPKIAEDSGKVHLRSIREMTGYKVEAEDSLVGTIDDFVAEEKNWVLRRLVLLTSHELSGRRVAVSPPDFIGEISWSHHSVKLLTTLATIRNLPDYMPAAGCTRP